ncbi:GNAT family N-acetyltransferase [Arthrobacter sp. TWP1-1]|uniref:GNAT family N-acetyltransferase n=1 Tax=Arthrobacter sp. TWP1-1 TaxID=2804568 RepID=UPI003CF03919
MSSLDAFELIAEPPALDEYLDLRRDAGLSQKTRQQGAGALAGSWFFCHVRDKVSGRTVAMGRAIGDGGWCFHIADMATLPEYQGRGLGRLVIDTLVARIHETAPENPYITLVADPPGRRLYEQAGFTEINPSRGMELPWVRVS